MLVDVGEDLFYHGPARVAVVLALGDLGRSLLLPMWVFTCH